MFKKIKKKQPKKTPNSEVLLCGRYYPWTMQYSTSLNSRNKYSISLFDNVKNTKLLLLLSYSLTYCICFMTFFSSSINCSHPGWDGFIGISPESRGHGSTCIVGDVVCDHCTLVTRHRTLISRQWISC